MSRNEMFFIIFSGLAGQEIAMESRGCEGKSKEYIFRNLQSGLRRSQLLTGM